MKDTDQPGGMYIRVKYDEDRPFHKRKIEGSLECLCGWKAKSERSIVSRKTVRDVDVCYFCQSKMKVHEYPPTSPKKVRPRKVRDPSQESEDELLNLLGRRAITIKQYVEEIRRRQAKRLED